MRLLRPLAAAAVALAVLPAVAHARAPLCQDRPGRDLAHAGADRVLETRQPSRTRRGDTIVRVISCRQGSRAVKTLFRTVSRDDLAYRAEEAAITPGKYVVVAISGATSSAGWVDVDQFDLRTGARNASVHQCRVDGLWAGRSGGFAFGNAAGTATVVDAAGPRTVGGTGAGDFAVGGDTLYWTEVAGVRSTTLGAAPRGRFGADVDCG